MLGCGPVRPLWGWRKSAGFLVFGQEKNRVLGAKKIPCGGGGVPEGLDTTYLTGW